MSLVAFTEAQRYPPTSVSINPEIFNIQIEIFNSLKVPSYVRLNRDAVIIFLVDGAGFHCCEENNPSFSHQFAEPPPLSLLDRSSSFPFRSIDIFLCQHYSIF